MVEEGGGPGLGDNLALRCWKEVSQIHRWHCLPTCVAHLLQSITVQILTAASEASSRTVSCRNQQAVQADDSETKNFIYFYLGPTAILLWKTS